MHYILLGIGLLLGLYGLYRFFLSATPKQIATLFVVALLTALCAALFVMAVTGRLPAALALVAALWPFVMAYWHRRHRQQKQEAGTAQETTGANAPMTRQEALDILGLGEHAGADEIKAAYKKLMKKVHPDQEGSAWMAQKLNQAKALLLQQKD